MADRELGVSLNTAARSMLTLCDHRLSRRRHGSTATAASSSTVTDAQDPRYAVRDATPSSREARCRANQLVGFAHDVGVDAHAMPRRSQRRDPRLAVHDCDARWQPPTVLSRAQRTIWRWAIVRATAASVWQIPVRRGVRAPSRCSRRPTPEIAGVLSIRFDTVIQHIRRASRRQVRVVGFCSAIQSPRRVATAIALAIALRAREERASLDLPRTAPR